MTALSVRDLTAGYGGAPAVRSVSFELAAGRWTGLIGANGSGKTTLLRCLAGRRRPWSGRIEIDGRDLAGDARARVERIGWSPPPDSLPTSVTVSALIGLLEQARRSPAPDTTASLMAEALQLESIAAAPIGALSSGQKQRVAIRTAFVGSPRIVLLDEPFNWLDPAAAYDVKAALRRATAEHGLTLLTALHDTAALALCCDAGLLMSEGRMALEIATADLKAAREDLGAFETAIVSRLRAR